MEYIAFEHNATAAELVRKTYDTPPLAFVHSYGCQQNVNDGERIKGVLVDIGYGLCDKPEDADLILFNTCAVREHAEQRVFGNVGALKGLKEKKPGLMIGLCGCMANQKHVVEKLRQSYPYVDLVFGVDGIDTLPQLIAQKLQKHKRVLLELSREIDEEIIQSLCKNLKLDPKRVFEYDSPLDHSFLFQIEDQLRSHTDLFFAPRHPQPSPALDERKPIIPQILEEDKLIHYPYESIRPFLQLLHEAACDPDVVSIKMTLYRLANHSKVVDALVEAAENGKQVDVLMELKARFDEENNIEWSRLLERAGCHVVYGIEGLKVHSKLCLITRKTKEGISFITQIGTGNYNEKTSRLYTDLSFLTASKEIGLEATEVFRALDQGETVDSVKNLLVAPHCLQNRLLL